MPETTVTPQIAPALADVAAGAGPATPCPLDGFVVETLVGFLLRRAYQRYASVWQEDIAEGIGEQDLTPRQFTALVKVVLNGRVTQNQLGRMAAMDPATIQGVVRRLMARGLVERRLDPLDRRTTVLTATPEGIDLARRGAVHARRASARTIAPLSPEERRTLLDLLARIA